ncbi:DUF2752 domain-containing protein [bacterium]|nr:DUF2752 domain-containing protein [bacterium]
MKFYLTKLSKGETDYELIWGAIFLFVLLIVQFFPFDHIPYYRCPFKSITGIPCPTCGFTSAFLLMRELRISEAFRTNPLGCVSYIAIFIFTIYAFTVKVFKLKRIRVSVKNKKTARIIRVSVVLVIAINWVYLIFNHFYL